MNHWAATYIGRKSRDVGFCWGLLRLIYNDLYGIILPQFPGIGPIPDMETCARIREQVQTDWMESPIPFEGCAVAMGLKEDIHHVGIYTSADGGKIIHAWHSYNVIADRFLGLRFKGFHTIKFYRHVLWPISS